MQLTECMFNLHQQLWQQEAGPFYFAFIPSPMLLAAVIFTPPDPYVRHPPSHHCQDCNIQKYVINNSMSWLKKNPHKLQVYMHTYGHFNVKIKWFTKMSFWHHATFLLGRGCTVVYCKHMYLLTYFFPNGCSSLPKRLVKLVHRSKDPSNTASNCWLIWNESYKL